MAKLTRERALRERREIKQAKKAARRLAAASPHETSEPAAIESAEIESAEIEPAASEPAASEPGGDAPPRSV